MVVAYAAGYNWSLQPASITWGVFLNYNSENSFHPTLKQYRDLREQCEVVPFSKSKTADVAIMTEIDCIERRHRQEKMRPIVCLITGDRDFSGIVEKLQAERFDDFILIHRDDTRKAMLSNVPNTIKWSDVQALNEMSIREQVNVLPVPPHFRVVAQTARATRCSVPITAFDTTSIERLLSAEQWQFQYLLSVLCRLRSIGWVIYSEGCNAITGDGLTFCAVTTERVELKRQSHSRYAEKYILPELRQQYNAIYSEGIVRPEHVEIEQMAVKKKVEIQQMAVKKEYWLEIRSVDENRASSVALEVRKRLIQLTECSQKQPLERWTKYHADAFISSKVIKAHALCQILHAISQCLIFSNFRCLRTWK
jgi:hypothetical protein